MVRIIITDFLQFLVKPNTTEIDFGKNKILKKILFLLCLLPFVFAIATFLLFAGNFILTVLGVEMPDINGIGGKTAAKKAGLSLVVIYIAGAIVAPITEEIRFRLLLKFNRLFIALSIAMFRFAHIFSWDFYKGKFDWNFIQIQIMISIALFLVIYFALGIKKINNFIKTYLYEKYFGFFFYAILIYFGILHFNSGEFSPYIITTTIPQIVVGFFYAYYRLKLGFGYAVLIHILWNSISILV